MGTENLRDLNLKPRAVAILVALRNGSKTLGQLADAIADDDLGDTMDVLRSMERDHKLVVLLREQSIAKRAYVLDMDGIGWLQNHGLDATERAKKELYSVLDAKSKELSS